MKLLVEASIIPSSEVAEIQKKKPDARREDIKKVVDNNTVFPNQAAIADYKDIIRQSIEDYGFDPASNKFLPFAQYSNVAVKREQARFMQRVLQSGDLKIDKRCTNPSWVKDERAYSGPDYKLKALIFLSSSEASSYGDPKDAKNHVIPDILGLSDEEAIRNRLNNWQTKDGQGSSSSDDSRGDRGTEGGDEAEDKKTSGSEDLKKYIRKYFKDTDKSVRDTKAQTLQRIALLKEIPLDKAALVINSKFADGDSIEKLLLRAVKQLI